MFEARGKIEIFKRIVETISMIVSEAKFNVESGGLQIRAVDPAHVAMVDLRVDPEAYDEFKADNVELGVDLDKLGDIIKLGRGSEAVHLVYDEHSQRMVMTIGNLVRRMTLLDTATMSDPKIPNLQFPAKIEISTEELMRGIRAAESVSDYVILLVEQDKFELSAGTQEQMVQTFDEDKLFSIECKDRVRSLFSLDYLSSMVKAIKEDRISLSIGNDYPVRIDFSVLNGHGKVSYLLAPRTEAE